MTLRAIVSKRRLSGRVHPMLVHICLGPPKRTYDVLDVLLDCGHYVAFDYSTDAQRRRLIELRQWECDCGAEGAP